MKILIGYENSRLKIVPVTPDASTFVSSIPDRSPTELPKILATCRAKNITVHPVVGLRSQLEQWIQRIERCDLTDLLPHQSEGVGFLAGNAQALLADDMGLGKTVQALRAIPPSRPAIIIVPPFLTRQWMDEHRRWRSDVDGVEAMTWRATADHLKRYSDNHVLLRNTQLPGSHEKIALHPGTHVILDEVHQYKNYGAARTRAVRRIVTAALKRKGSVWGLTGTPILTSPNDLWGVLQTLKLGTHCYGSYTRYVRAWGTEAILGQVDWARAKPTADTLAPIRPYILRRERRNIFPLLEYIETYHRLDVDLLPWTDGSSEAEASIQGRSESNELMTTRQRLAVVKARAATTYLDALDGPTLIYSAHRESATLLAHVHNAPLILGGMPDRARNIAIRSFQNGESDTLIATIGAGGIGLNLQRARHVVFIDYTFTPADIDQAIGRAVRYGREDGDPVLVHHIVADHWIDEVIERMILRKRRHMQTLQTIEHTYHLAPLKAILKWL